VKRTDSSKTARCLKDAKPARLWIGIVRSVTKVAILAGVFYWFLPGGFKRQAEVVLASSDSGSVLRLDPALDSLIPKGAEPEKIASGFQFIEGPLWFSSGHLWFSDVIGNVVRQWSPSGVTEILGAGGGYAGTDAPKGSLVGPNGMAHDANGAVLLCQHGNRRIVRVSPDLRISAVVDRYQGKRLNSPNDLVFKSDGALYFTDPPYGLTKQDDDPKKELPFNAVFRFAHGKLTTVVTDLTRPNGIAFSPDEKQLFISNSDEKHKVWMVYDVAKDGSAGKGRVVFDVTDESAPGLPDGMKIDSKGNLYCAGPGGIWIFTLTGKHLGTIKLPEIAANCNWGDDGKTLYITASTSLYRIKLAVAGERALYR
jgi:gluconolactonase